MASADTPTSSRAAVLVVEHERNAGAGLVGERLLARGFAVTTVGPDAGREIPLTPAGYAGVVVLGGTPGPTDDEQAAWLPRVRELVAGCLTGAVPVLGICLGAQILAVVAGGAVGPAAKGPEVGLGDLTLTAAGRGDPVLGDLPESVRALQWHFLEVVDLPEGAQSLCRSDRCANQAFRVGPVAWGVQFHLEGLSATARAWARDDSDGLRAVGRSAADVVDEVRRSDAELVRWWSAVTDRWLDVVHAGTVPPRRASVDA